MIDEDDDDIPDFVVGSGSEHQVSVSEYTGNAQTPHNKVVSHEEEALARKLNFEDEHLVSDNHVKLAQEQSINGSRADIADFSVATNVQKISTDAALANRQTIQAESVDSNRASLPGEEQVSDNHQVLPAHASAGNNRQKLPPTPSSAASGADTSTAGSAHLGGLNGQHVPLKDEVNNHPSIHEPSVSDNHQVLDHPNDPVRNRQALHSEVAGNPNHPTTPQAPGTDTNRQPLGTENIKDHRVQVTEEPIKRAQVDDPKTQTSSPSTRATLDDSEATLADHADKPTHLDEGLDRQNSAHGGASLGAHLEVHPGAHHAGSNLHQRIEDLKHKVDDLNHRLTDIEHKHP